jgi:lysozyme family protein
MADFTKAYEITILGNEGGYNPGTDENETYRGIDRGANPNWSGWTIIDNIKLQNSHTSTNQINMLLSINNGLQAHISNFYKANYWDVLQLGKVNDQQLANNLFDCSVNQGEGLARRLMQTACNEVIIAIKAPIKPLVVDRQIGPVTLTVFNSLPPAQLNYAINAERKASYSTDSEYAEWGKVWEKRLMQYT